MKVKDVTNYLESIAPLQLQEDYDNSGLIIGNSDEKVKGALICLDVTEEVIREAISLDCNLIIGWFFVQTLVFVSGKALAQMSMLAPSVVVIIFVGMGALTGDSGYSSETPPLSVMALPLLTIVLTFVLGIAGYLHKDGE